MTDIGPEPPEPTEDDRAAMAAMNLRLHWQNKWLRRIRPFYFAGAVVLFFYSLTSEWRYSFIVVLVAILVSFAISAPFMADIFWPEIKRGWKAWDKTVNYMEWHEHKALVENPPVPEPREGET